MESVMFVMQVIVPITLIYWNLTEKYKSKIDVIGNTLLLFSIIFTLNLSASFSNLFNLIPAFYTIAFITCFIKAFKKFKTLPWKSQSNKKAWILIVISLFFTIDNPIIIGSPRAFPKEDAISLNSPFRNGFFQVLGGGSSQEVNHHYVVNAQKYALDVVKVNFFGLGNRKKLFSKELNDFEIFNEKLYAPCSGEVIQAVNNVKDEDIGTRNFKQAAGNHVVIFCKNSSVTLAHLKRGSLTVKEGDLVKEGDHIGNVGNSGHTSEPHLHIHANKGRVTGDDILNNAESIPMLFKEKYLIQNDFLM